MKANYDFSKGVRGKFAGTIPADAVFVTFDAQVSALFGEGSLTERLRAAGAKGRSAQRMIQSIALSRREYTRLRPLLERLGGKVYGAAPRAGRRKAS